MQPPGSVDKGRDAEQHPGTDAVNGGWVAGGGRGDALPCSVDKGRGDEQHPGSDDALHAGLVGTGRRRVGVVVGGWVRPVAVREPRPLSPSSLPQVDDLVKELGGPGLASAPSGGKGKPSLLSDAPSASSAGTQQQGGLVGELAASGSNSAAAQQYSAATAAPASSLLASEAVRLLLSVLQVVAVLYLGAGVWSAAGSLKGIAASLAARPGGAGAGADL